MSPAVALALLVAVVIAEWGLEALAQTLQLRHQPAAPPAELAGHVDSARYERTLAYVRTHTRWRRLQGGVTTVAWVGLLATGALGAAHTTVVTWAGAAWWAPLLFIGLLALAFDLLAVPFDLIRTFAIEARYGFNTTKPATFVRDRVTGYGLALLLGGTLLALLWVSVSAWGPAFWWPYAMVAAAVMTLLAAFQTSVILPLFNRLTPLPEGELRDAIADVVRRGGFDLDATYVMDGSKRSTKANAFFSGIGRRKRVVLYDTLIDRHPLAETAAVVAHEVGHAKLAHLPRLLLAGVASLTLTLFVLSRVVESEVLSLALGGGERALALNLVAFSLLYGPVSTAVGAATNALSRRFEYEADAFAAALTERDAMAAALRRLCVDALSLPLAHPLYAWLYLTHPAPVNRLRALLRSP